MEKFEHRYADSSQRGWRNEGGGFVSDMLIIASNIPLDETAPGYDPEKATKLFMAAVEYAKPRGLNIKFMKYDNTNRA